MQTRGKKKPDGYHDFLFYCLSSVDNTMYIVIQSYEIMSWVRFDHCADNFFKTKK